MAELEGYPQLQARLNAIGSAKFGANLMKQLGVAANREQKLLTAPNKKTGVTQGSIGYRDATSSGVTTFAANAARFLESGTKPHVIRPKNARVLAWAAGQAGGASRRLSGATRKGVGSGEMTFAMSVNHPGTKPYPFMVPGAKLALSKAGLANLVVKAWNDAA